MNQSKLCLLILLPFLYCCNTPKNAANTSKCTPPTKRYTKDLDLKVKASIDSLKYFSSADLELGVTQKVIHLTDYSTAGVDVDLVLWRICETAFTMKLSPDQTQALMSKAIDVWNSKTTTPKTTN